MRSALGTLILVSVLIASPAGWPETREGPGRSCDVPKGRREGRARMVVTIDPETGPASPATAPNGPRSRPRARPCASSRARRDGRRKVRGRPGPGKLGPSTRVLDRPEEPGRHHDVRLPLRRKARRRAESSRSGDVLRDRRSSAGAPSRLLAAPALLRRASRAEAAAVTITIVKQNAAGRASTIRRRLRPSGESGYDDWSAAG